MAVSDPGTEQAPADEAPRESAISSEIARTVGSIWQRRAGVRPSSVSTEVHGDTIRCRIEEGEAPAADAEDADGDEPATVDSTGTNAHRTEGVAAVARITKRNVSAYICKHDAKNGVATQTFILERSRVKY